MSPERWQQIEELFQAAVERPPQERPAFLTQACAGDEALRRAVELRLSPDEEAPTVPLATPLLAARPLPSFAGQSISHYKIISLLGKGGMGEVYQARDAKLDRTVALKILPAQVAADKERMQRFHREAKAASALNHPHVATIYEIGAVDGVSFIAMEYIEGQSLAAKINGTPLAVNEIVDLGSQIADALDEAHSKGITHRDIKPANVMLTLRGQVKVLDFGLAKIARPQSIDSQVSTLAKTEPGVMMGTVPYMSPEQALGRDVDQRSDLFSLGVVLYEMATGRLPFAGASTSETLDRILHAQPEAMARFNYDVPAELERIVRKCLEKERERRYQSARELLVDLKNLMRDSGEKVVSAEPIAIAPKRGLNRLILAGSLLVMLALTAVIAYWLSPRSSAIESVAVLPFINVGANPDTEYLSDGIAESLIRSLSQLPRLTVRSRDSAFRYKNRDVAAQVAGQELKVQAVLTGRVTQRGDDLSISVELVDVNNNSHLWGEQYQQKPANLLQVQETIAKEISDKLRLKLTSNEQNRLTKRYTENVEAYQLYQLGRYHWNKRTFEGFDKAIKYFTQAIEKDPGYALAYSGLADAYTLLDEYTLLGRFNVDGPRPKDVMPKALAAAEKAVQLDETLAEAHASLVFIKSKQWDWVGAEKGAKRAIELNPGYPTAYDWYAVRYLMLVGRLGEALGETQKALHLDPLSLVTNKHLGWHYYYAHRYDEAIKQYQKTLEIEPTYVTAIVDLGKAYEQKGMFEEAIAEFEKAITFSGESPTLIATRGYTYAASGKTGQAQKIVERLEEEAKRNYVPPYLIAEVYVGLGKTDQAFHWLEKAFEERSPLLLYLGIEPRLDKLRSDPRFIALLKRLGLKPRGEGKA